MQLREAMPRASLLCCTTALLVVAFVPIARADDADKAACADKNEGDACTRGDGDPGTCVPDDSDPVLTCEDSVGDDGNSDGDGADDRGDDDDDDGCSIGGSGSFTGIAMALLLASQLLRRRGR